MLPAHVDIPLFDGENPRSWVGRCQEHFHVYAILEDQKLELVVLYLGYKNNTKDGHLFLPLLKKVSSCHIFIFLHSRSCGELIFFIFLTQLQLPPSSSSSNIFIFILIFYAYKNNSFNIKITDFHLSYNYGFEYYLFRT